MTTVKPRIGEPKTSAERRLVAAAGFVAEAQLRRNEVIVDTAHQGISRRRAAELVGLAPSRVQQIINAAKEND